MKKLFVTFLFSSIIMVTHIVPMCQALVEGKYEIILVADIDDEESNKQGKEIEDKELKILYSNDPSSFIDQNQKKQLISYYSENYPSFYQKLVSPPPELYFSISII